MPFDSYARQLDSRSLAWARLVHGRVFEAITLAWVRKGTWIEAWNGRRRIAFAPHRQYASLYFQGTEAVERYRDWGGRCPTGKVCIKVPIGSEFEGALLARVVADYLGLAGGSTRQSKGRMTKGK